MVTETAEQALYVGLDVPRGELRQCPSVPCLNGSAEFFVRFVSVLYVFDAARKGGNSVDILKECFDYREFP